jgi:hypothetical protein
MKKNALGAIAIALFFSVVSCKDKKADFVSTGTPGFAVMKFSESAHDFGEINAYDKVEHTFEFTNEGDTNLIIESAKGSCGCTVPDYPKEPVEPGESGKITVKFDPSGKNGKQHKVVTIVANTENKIEKLDVRATIVGGTDGPITKTQKTE